MELDGFDWDDGNREHCRRHGVTLAEIERLFLGMPLVGPDPYRLPENGGIALSAGRRRDVSYSWCSPGDWHEPNSSFVL